MEKEKIIQQIEQLEEKQVQAILKSDIDTLKSIWSKIYTLIIPLTW